jgi:hypothetical protein
MAVDVPGRYLSFFSNQIFGSIPSTLGNLAALQ